MQSLYELQKLNQSLIPWFTIQGPNIWCYFNCHTTMLCALLSSIQCTTCSLDWQNQHKKVWKENDLIGEKDFELLQRRVNTVIPPPKIESPSKLPQDLVALQQTNGRMVFYYSAFALKGILRGEHSDAWIHFVTACRLICVSQLQWSSVGG